MTRASAARVLLMPCPLTPAHPSLYHDDGRPDKRRRVRLPPEHRKGDMVPPQGTPSSPFPGRPPARTFVSLLVQQVSVRLSIGMAMFVEIFVLDMFCRVVWGCVISNCTHMVTVLIGVRGAKPSRAAAGRVGSMAPTIRVETLFSRVRKSSLDVFVERHQDR